MEATVVPCYQNQESSQVIYVTYLKCCARFITAEPGGGRKSCDLEKQFLVGRVVKTHEATLSDAHLALYDIPHGSMQASRSEKLRSPPQKRGTGILDFGWVTGKG